MSDPERVQHQYPISADGASSRWSGLSRTATEALVDTAVGPSAASKLLGSEEAAAAGETAGPEVDNWARQELERALESWRKYEGNLIAVPESVDQLMAGNPNFAATATRLFNARNAISQNGEQTPGGENVGATMHLVMIPWEDMKGSLSRFGEWVQRLRNTQGIATSDDFIGSNMVRALSEDKPIYRDPSQPDTLLKASEYLDRAISIDGLWGVMLAQASSEAGMRSKVGQSPDSLTGEGERHLTLEGYDVDAMGVLEWIALTLQEDPSKLSNEDYSWLLANRLLPANGAPEVACGGWLGDRVGSFFGPAGAADEDTRPRLAVM